MTDTPKPRSNAISPVVFMGSGGPDMTAPEAVERFNPIAVAPHDVDPYGAMETDSDGDYVRYDDYAALSAALEGERAKPPSYRFTAANLRGSVTLGFDDIQRSDVPEACLFHGGKAVIVGSYISFDGVAIMPVPYWEAEKARADAAEAERDGLKETLAYCENQWAETDRKTQAKMLAERKRAAAAEAKLKEAGSHLEAMIDAFEEHVALPDKNCLCHIAPPCGDCETYSFARETVSDARAFLASIGDKP